MIVWLIAWAVFCLIGVRWRDANRAEDPWSPEQTGTLKGALVLLVLFSHVRQYLILGEVWSGPLYAQILNGIGQLMVAPFLFFSGYGVGVSIRNQPGYVRTLPKRIARLWLRFAGIVLIYAAVESAIGIRVTLKNLGFSLLGLHSMGNSVWFAVVILLLYAVMYFTFTVFRRNFYVGAAVATLLSVALMFLLRHLKSNETWWYDTVLCFPAGIWFAAFAPKLREWSKSSVKYLAITVSLTICVIFLQIMSLRHPNTRRWFLPEAPLFSLLIALLLLRFSLRQPALRWLGGCAFEFYLLQRIPMILLFRTTLNQYPVVFTAVTLIASLCLAAAASAVCKKLDPVLHLAAPPRPAAECVGAVHAKAENCDNPREK